MGFVERVKDFFEIPPKHDLKVGDLVTCTCHGGVAIVLELYDDPEMLGQPKMNMAKIWWIKRTYDNQERVWMHTIARLNKYGRYVKDKQLHSYYMRDQKIGDELHPREYIKGDLVIHVGHVPPPDMVYAEHFTYNLSMGIVIARAGGHGRDKMYKVYWLRDELISSVASGQLQLAYVRNKAP